MASPVSLFLPSLLKVFLQPGTDLQSLQNDRVHLFSYLRLGWGFLAFISLFVFAFVFVFWVLFLDFSFSVWKTPSSSPFCFVEQFLFLPRCILSGVLFWDVSFGGFSHARLLCGFLRGSLGLGASSCFERTLSFLLFFNFEISYFSSPFSYLSCLIFSVITFNCSTIPRFDFPMRVIASIMFDTTEVWYDIKSYKVENTQADNPIGWRARCVDELTLCSG